jgi:hypothetical protein
MVTPPEEAAIRLRMYCNLLYSSSDARLTPRTDVKRDIYTATDICDALDFFVQRRGLKIVFTDNSTDQQVIRSDGDGVVDAIRTTLMNMKNEGNNRHNMAVGALAYHFERQIENRVRPMIMLVDAENKHLRVEVVLPTIRTPEDVQMELEFFYTHYKVNVEWYRQVLDDEGREYEEQSENSRDAIEKLCFAIRGMERSPQYHFIEKIRTMCHKWSMIMCKPYAVSFTLRLDGIMQVNIGF